MKYYEKHNGDLNVFEPLLNRTYKNFTKQDHMNDIVRYEKDYTNDAYDYARKHGYTLNYNKPYFLGFGTNSIVYKVKDDKGDIYAMKLYIGGKSELFDKELGGYEIISNSPMKLYSVKIKDYEYNHKENIGFIIYEYAGIPLEELIRVYAPHKDIIEFVLLPILKKIKNMMIGTKVFHHDLHDRNVMIKCNEHGDGLLVYLIDYEEITKKRLKDKKDSIKDIDSLIDEMNTYVSIWEE